MKVKQGIFNNKHEKMLTSQKLVPIAKGMIKKLLISRKHDAQTYGTNDAKYCYSVWMRHLHFAGQFGYDPQDTTVAELGPGDSIGIGLAALLSGCKKYMALDVIKYWNTERNLLIFDQLVNLFKNRSAIPDSSDLPKVFPTLENYHFPYEIISEKRIRKNLSDERISLIRNEIIALENNKSKLLQSFVPWNTSKAIAKNSVDYLFSQAVLAYVDDLDDLYRLMNGWLKNNCIMSHTIDFSSHGLTKDWNGQWNFSEREWKWAHGNSRIILNRNARSQHLALNYTHGFDALLTKDVKKESKYMPEDLHEDFSGLSIEDTRTFASFILSRKIREI